MSDFNYNMYAGQTFGNVNYNAGSVMGGAEAQPMMFNGAAGYNRGAFNKPAATPGTQVYSSNVLNDAASFVYCYDEATGTNVEHNVRQMVASDMSVFIEHIQGYHLVYVPVGASVDAATAQIVGAAALNGAGRGKRGDKAANMPKERLSKPSNAFIMYRNHKINELRKAMPEINQIDISREAGKWWKLESQEVKDAFKAKYQEEKLAYDMRKSKRGRAESMAAQYDDYGMAPPTKKYKKKNALGLGAGGAAKPRAHTMPAAQNFGASAARLALGGTYDPTPYESPELHQAYAELSASTGLQHPGFINGMQMFSAEQAQQQQQTHQQQQQAYDGTLMPQQLADGASFGDAAAAAAAAAGLAMHMAPGNNYAATIAASTSMAGNSSFYAVEQAGETNVNAADASWPGTINPADVSSLVATTAAENRGAVTHESG
ncbi:hypothetical protein GGI05_000150 [Coemansia sp. RSA 2603]|nr:hypothetical protein GGI05_000150 [Coemansia sp. RSA 2603]